MDLRRWWRRRSVQATSSRGTPSNPGSAELARLEALAEQAYSAMYDVPPLRSAKDDCDDACLYLQRAIETAGRLGLANEVARLRRRLDHVRAVYDSQFRGF